MRAVVAVGGGRVVELLKVMRLTEHPRRISQHLPLHQQLHGRPTVQQVATGTEVIEHRLLAVRLVQFLPQEAPPRPSLVKFMTNSLDLLSQVGEGVGLRLLDVVVGGVEDAPEAGHEGTLYQGLVLVHADLLLNHLKVVGGTSRQVLLQVVLPDV
ncbi:hypothetical protein NP493_206g01010 [Ridgeia piscesae]|uniref:Uncharacterized protein n=1 Tax=Ridgeia piscesae TaxID=27915 RepID=A0AAD9P1H5_RIDPI|nr:hypothetical protein NP493_206g01010 [Ridgeia piscesae]